MRPAGACLEAGHTHTAYILLGGKKGKKKANSLTDMGKQTLSTGLSQSYRE